MSLEEEPFFLPAAFLTLCAVCSPGIHQPPSNNQRLSKSPPFEEGKVGAESVDLFQNFNKIQHYWSVNDPDVKGHKVRQPTHPPIHPTPTPTHVCAHPTAKCNANVCVLEFCVYTAIVLLLFFFRCWMGLEQGVQRGGDRPDGPGGAETPAAVPGVAPGGLRGIELRAGLVSGFMDQPKVAIKTASIHSPPSRVPPWGHFFCDLNLRKQFLHFPSIPSHPFLGS